MTARRTIVSTQVGADVMVVGTATFHEIGRNTTTTFRYNPDNNVDTTATTRRVAKPRPKPLSTIRIRIEFSNPTHPSADRCSERS